MDKYYTPELSEFCFGFEYEALREDVWEKYTFPHPFSYCYADGQEPYLVEFFVDGLKEDIRVKYLDREDIERVLDNTEIIYNFINGILELKINNEIRYKGLCKNRSELKKIAEYIKY